MVSIIKEYNKRERQYRKKYGMKRMSKKMLLYNYIFWKKDLSNFKNKFGIEIPTVIYEYITCCPHTYIYGYYKERECIILFSAIDQDDGKIPKNYEDNFISLVQKWSKYGDYKKYLPIGWLDYSGSFVLFEISTGKIYVEDNRIDGQPKESALANSLVELIEKLELKLPCNYWPGDGTGGTGEPSGEVKPGEGISGGETSGIESGLDADIQNKFNDLLNSDYYKNVSIMKNEYFKALKEIYPEGFDVFTKTQGGKWWDKKKKRL